MVAEIRAVMWAARKTQDAPPSVTVGSSRVMTQVGHSLASVMTEGGSRDDRGGSQLAQRDD